MEIPEDLLFTKTHEWVRLDGDEATVGISDYAQRELGDIVYVELPAVDDDVVYGDTFGTIESVKSVSDLYAPLSGTVIEVNDELEHKPELVNQDPYGEGWMIKIKISDRDELQYLLSPEAYHHLLNGLE